MTQDIREILKLVTGNDNITDADIEAMREMNERKHILEEHAKNHKIWERGGIYYTYLPDSSANRGLKYCKRRSMEALNDAIVDYYKNMGIIETIDDVFKEWNDKRLDGKKIAKATHLRNRLCYERYFTEFGKRNIQHVLPYEYEDFLEEQIKKFNLTAKAFANLKSIVRGFLKRAKKRGLITFSVEEMLDDMDVTEREFKKSRKDDSEEIFYDNEMEKIVNFVKNNPSNGNLAIALMFCTGLRIGEVVTLKHSDFQGMTVTIRRSETRYRKEDGKYDYVVQDHPKSEAGFRTIVIPESYKWLIIRLRSCNPFGEWVFTKRDGKTRCTTNTIRTRMRCICRKLDIPFRSSHKIRKTYGSILLDNEVDTKLVQSQMGHSDISVTEGYYHKDRKKIQQKSDIINSIADFVI